MLSINALLLKTQMFLAKPIVRFSGIDAARAAQDNLGRISAGVLKSRIDYRDVPFENFEAAFAVPFRCPTEKTHVILYLHGGGYTAGGLDYAKGFGGVLAAATGLATLCVGYRLAPENKFPAALDDALAAYEFLLSQGYDPAHIAFVGESAGGGLCFCLCHRLKDEGKPLPGCIVAMSPWTDLTMSGKSYSNNLHRDPSLCRESLAYYVLVYAAGMETQPYVSPIFGDFTNFPPATVYAGGSEILLDDSRTLVQNLKNAGCHVNLTVEKGMWHVYPLYGTPEGIRAIKEMSEFIKARLAVPEGVPENGPCPLPAGA